MAEVDNKEQIKLTDRQKKGLEKILNMIASWTAARWDQHLRYEIPDEDANNVIKWLSENGINPYIPDKGKIK